MSAMLLSLVCYGKIDDFRINEIVDYILGHQMNDGGWNCAWDSVHNRSVVSSVHTTISVLEAFADYEDMDICIVWMKSNNKELWDRSIC